MQRKSKAHKKKLTDLAQKHASKVNKQIEYFRNIL